MMRILIVSGFLGSGKTTFIKALQRATQRTFVIVENEFANQDIDSNELEAALPQSKIYSIAEGCICCSMNLSFAHSVLTIANTLDPDYLVVEPSGVAKLIPIIEELSKIAYERIRLCVPLVLIDPLHCNASRINYPEYFDFTAMPYVRVLLTKSENMPPSEARQLLERFNLPEGAIKYDRHYSCWDDKMWHEILDCELTVDDFTPSTARKIVGIAKGDLPHKHDSVPVDALRSIAYRVEEPCHPFNMVTLLNHMVQGLYGRVLRAKGYFACGTQYFKVDLVQDRFKIAPSDPKDPIFIVIGEAMQLDGIPFLQPIDQ